MLSVPAKPGTKRCLATSPAVGLRVEELDHEGGDDDADERRDPGLQPAEAHLLEAEDREGAGAGEHPGREERDAEEQVEAERGADHLGDVGRHRDDLGLDPEADRGPAREAPRGRARPGSCRSRSRASPTGSGRPSRSGSPRGSPRAAGSRTWRRRRCWSRSCRGRCRRRRRRRRGRGRARAGTGPVVWPSSERRAAAATAASPGRTSSTVHLGRRRRRCRRRLHRSPPPAGGGRRSGPGIGVPCGSWLGSPSLAAISSSSSSEM